MFKTEIKVRFNHVDFAGIVFYPRYFEMFNQVVEEWVEAQLGYDLRRLHDEFKAGVPTVHINTDFVNPSSLGDVLTFSLTVENVGKSSINVVLQAHCNDQLRLIASLTLVYIVNTSSGNISASKIPANLKKLMLET